MTNTSRLVIAVVCALAACGNDPQPEETIVIDGPENNENNDNNQITPEPVETQYLSTTEHLNRISLAIRGIKPSPEELRLVVDDPTAMESIVDIYLESDAFHETIREMHGDDWNTRFFFFAFPPLGPENVDRGLIEFTTKIHEQPLRLIEHIVKNDRPYTEIVTADYTVANQDVATVWGLQYDGNGEEWVETRWPEPQRPHSGLLSESMIWIRHYSSPLNAQRVRANLVSKNLLCYDFLKREVNVDGNVDLSDPDAVNLAVEQDASCVSCHQALDPLANMFWTWEYFIAPTQIQQYPVSNWQPSYDIEHRPIFSRRNKGYFGKPLNNMLELGQEIADDPRFALCTARRFYSYMTQVPQDQVPDDLVRDYTNALLESDFNVKGLIKAIVFSDAFKTLSTTDTGKPNLIKVRPHSLSQIGRQLADFSWEMDVPFPLFGDQGIMNNYGRVDLLRDTLFGYGVLAGGIDDFIVVNPQHEFSPSAAVVYETYAQEFAGTVVPEEFARSIMERKLLMIAEDEDDEIVIRLQLSKLHARFWGELDDANSAEVDDTFALYQEALAASGDNVRAWTVVVSAMMRSPRFLYY